MYVFFFFFQILTLGFTVHRQSESDETILNKFKHLVNTILYEHGLEFICKISFIVGFKSLRAFCDYHARPGSKFSRFRFFVFAVLIKLNLL